MKKSFILLLFFIQVSCVIKSQTPWYLTGNTTSGSEVIGSTTGNFDLNYVINNSPLFQMLTTGDFNIITNTQGYMINNNYVLRNNGVNSNLYVGVNAGSNNATTSNTFVGNNAGTATTGSNNTYVGYNAGVINSSGYYNSFFGEQSGASNTTGYHNTFIGGHAGFLNQSGKSNTIVGFEAGYSSVADYNTFVGRETGYHNTGFSNSMFGKASGFNNTGSGNCFFGSHAGFNTGYTDGNSYFGQNAGYQIVGSGNSFYGNYAGVYMTSGDDNIFIGNHVQDDGGAYPVITNSTVVGTRAIVTASNKMILGKNNIKVGIGLSGDNVQLGPQNNLEINADPNSFVTHSGYDQSGLRFRQLTSASTNNILTPYGKVLTVNSVGDVVLTDAFGYGVCNNFSTLPNDIGMKLRDYRIFYEGQNETDPTIGMLNSIALGYNVCTGALPGKLSVNQEWTSTPVFANTIAGYFRNGDSSGIYNYSLIADGKLIDTKNMVCSK